METTRSIANRLLVALHIGLLIASIATLAMPSQQAVVYPIFKALFFVECASMMYRTWRMGYLAATPDQIAKRVQATGKRVTSGPLERWATGVAFATIAIVTFFY